MKIAVCRLFEDARRAEGTVRELILMQIPQQDITVTTLRDGEQRSFQPCPGSGEGGRPGGVLIHAKVDQEDGPRVEATLVRNGGIAVRSPGDWIALSATGAAT